MDKAKEQEEPSEINTSRAMAVLSRIGGSLGLGLSGVVVLNSAIQGEVMQRPDAPFAALLIGGSVFSLCQARSLDNSTDIREAAFYAQRTLENPDNSEST
jgi:hypothetical protein